MNKLSRLTALLLALLMLLSSTGLAEAGSAIPFDGFTYSLYKDIFQSASQAAGDAEDSEDEYKPVVHGSIDLIEKMVQTIDEEVWIYEVPDYTVSKVLLKMPKGTKLLVLDYIPGDAEKYSEFYYVRHTAEDGTVTEGYTECRQVELYEEPKIVEKTEEKTTEDGTKVTVSGSMPENVELKVASASVEAIESYIPGAKDMPMRKLVLDIALTDDLDIVWQPDEPVSVTVNAANLGDEGDTIALYHIHGQQVEHIGEAVMDANSNITFTMDGFSYIFAVNLCDELGCILSDLETMTPDERYTEVMELGALDRGVFLLHYYVKHAKTGILCNCSDFRAPGVEGHDMTCTWHPGTYFQPVVGGADGTSVTVSGNVPAGVKMNVKGLTAAEAAQVLPGIENFDRYIAMDISLLQAGSEWQPVEGEMINVTLSAEKLGEDGDEIAVYHIHGDETELLGMFTVQNGSLSFDIDGFSYICAIDPRIDYCYVEDLKLYEDAQDRYDYLQDLEAADLALHNKFLGHYKLKHKGEHVICECDMEWSLNPTVYAPWGEGHNEDCPWHPDNKPVEDPFSVTVDGTTVSVSGELPEGAKLNVSGVSEETIAAYIPTIGAYEHKVMLDVTLKEEDGVEVQPEGKVTVQISTSSLGKDGDVIALFHISNGAVEYLGTKTLSGGSLTYETSSFSYVVGVTIADLCPDNGECEYEAFYKMGAEAWETELAALYNADTYHTAYNMFIAHVLSYHGTGEGVCLCVNYHPDTHKYGTLVHTTATDTYGNPIECSWAFKNLKAEEQVKVLETIEDPATKAEYVETLDETKQEALKGEMTEAQKAEIDFLLSEGVLAWLASGTVTPEMLQRAIEVHAALTAANATFTWNVASRLEGTELIDVYTGLAYADYDPETNGLRDRLTGLYVGTLAADGTIIGPDSFVINVTVEESID